MIRITNVGTFGRRVGGRVVPTTAADGPFETDGATEAMLVAQGIAEYVKAAPVRYDRMRKADLLALAASRGLYEGDADSVTAKSLAAILSANDSAPAAPDDPRAGEGTAQEGDAGAEGDAAADPEGNAGAEGAEDPAADPEGEGEEPPVIGAAPVVED